MVRRPPRELDAIPGDGDAPLELQHHAPEGVTIGVHRPVPDGQLKLIQCPENTRFVNGLASADRQVKSR